MSATNSNAKASASSATETKVVTKEAINRLLKDVKQTQKETKRNKKKEGS